MRQRDFELVELVVARFVHARRLAGRADEQAAEQIAQAGVVVPIGEQAGQQVGAAQKRRIGRCGPAEHEVVAAAGAGVAAVGHEFFGAQVRLVRRFVEELGVLDQLAPVVRRVDVDLDHARVGGDLQQLEAGIARRRVAFEHHPQAQLGGRGFHCGQQLQVGFELLQRRHEHIQMLALAAVAGFAGWPVGALWVAGFNAQGGAHQPGGRFAALRNPHRAARLLRRVRLAQYLGAGQGRAGGLRVGFGARRAVGRRGPRQRIERQPVAHGRVAGYEVEALLAQQPRPAAPAPAALRRRIARSPRCRARLAVIGLQRQHIAHRRLQALPENAAQARALVLVVELGVKGVHVEWQLAFAPQVVPGVLKAGPDVLGRQAQLLRQRLDEALCLGGAVLRRLAFVGQQGGLLPDRLAVGAPKQRQRPAWQLLTGVPLALAQVQAAAGPVLLAQAVQQVGGINALGRAQRIGVPLGRIAVAGGHEGGLAAHGQAHIVGVQVLLDLLAQGVDGAPLRLGVGFGDARRFQAALHLHVVLKRDLAFIERT